MDGDPYTQTNLYDQSIRLKPETTPIYRKPYRIPQSQKQEIDKQVNELLRQKIIEPAASEWSSPILLVPKKTDSKGSKKWRLVIDYRRLNESIADEKFPLANITDILDSLAGAVYFSTFDLSQGFYQLAIKQEHRGCTAFVTDKGQYQKCKLPMGLKISPSAFSRMMTIALAGLNYENCFVYLDDIIVFGKNLEQHNRNLIMVLDRLRKVNLKLNPEKCVFMKKSVLYLGHSISDKGIKPDPSKLESIRNYPIPKNADELKRFVALANYYRKFVRNFSILAAPLNKLQKKGVAFIWTPKCQEAFENIIEGLTSSEMLDYPDFSDDNTFVLTTDASKIGLGAVLAKSNGKPVAFASRTLNKAETNYSTTEIELLAIVWAVKHFRPYLFGRYFEIQTDHRALPLEFFSARGSIRNISDERNRSCFLSSSNFFLISSRYRRKR
jgi:RNase H-like domain found in reverse transcriptase/Reverse transcriptase (RNA-dependent DNA polymerase)